MRLIDADKLLEGEHFILKCKSEFGITEMDVFRREVIDNAPTVEPVKQCKFCKHWGDEDYCSDCHSDHSLFEYYSRPQGKWVKGREISRTMIADKVQHIDYKDYTCSNCGLVLDNLLYHYDGSPFYKFCPECGAKNGGRIMDTDFNKMYNKMIVTDYGICIRKFIDDTYFGDSIVITKEAFIEAYNRWIKEAENEDSN